MLTKITFMDKDGNRIGSVECKDNFSSVVDCCINQDGLLEVRCVDEGSGEEFVKYLCEGKTSIELTHIPCKRCKEG